MRPSALPASMLASYELDDLDAAALDAVLDAFAAVDQDEDDATSEPDTEEDPDLAITASEADPYDAISNLDEQELERVASALAKGV
jgi:hypothetical protein